MRAAIFIDAGYLFKHASDQRSGYDYRSLSEYLLAPLRRGTHIDMLRCYFYYCPPWMSSSPTDSEKRRMESHNRLVSQLESIDRWQFREGKLEKRREGDRDVFAQKRVDVMLSVDLVRHAAAGHIQHAVILAGDSDFIPAIKAAKEEGVTVSLWGDSDGSVHRDLSQVADEVHVLDLSKMKRDRERGGNAKPERKPKTLVKKAAKSTTKKRAGQGAENTKRRAKKTVKRAASRGKKK